MLSHKSKKKRNALKTKSRDNKCSVVKCGLMLLCAFFLPMVILHLIVDSNEANWISNNININAKSWKWRTESEDSSASVIEEGKTLLSTSWSLSLSVCVCVFGCNFV